MPRSKVVATPKLEIQLDSPQAAWTGGQAITGCVSRCAPVVSTQATISVRLLGRAKTKMRVSHGQSSSTYRSRFNFWPSQLTEVQLMSGPLHIPETGDMHSWRFSLVVPDRLDPATVSFENKQKCSFLPLEHQQIETQSMPPSFYTKGVWLNTNYEAYVEYFIQADLTSESSGSTKTDTATLPLNIVARSTPGHISEYNLERSTVPCCLSGHRLLPGAQNSSLSLQQRTQQLFRSSKVPQYGFTLQVECPRTLQIGNPSHVPFKLLAIRESSQTTDVLRDHQIELNVSSVELEIRSATAMRSRGLLGAHDCRGSQKHRLVNDTAKAALGSLILVPGSEKSQPLDVGQALGLSLKYYRADLGVDSHSTLSHFLYPSFATFNIRNSHKLVWKVELSCAGETTKVSGEVELTILSILSSSGTLQSMGYDGASPQYEVTSEETVPSYEEVVPSPSKAGYPAEKDKKHSDW